MRKEKRRDITSEYLNKNSILYILVTSVCI